MEPTTSTSLTPVRCLPDKHGKPDTSPVAWFPVIPLAMREAGKPLPFGVEDYVQKALTEKFGKRVEFYRGCLFVFCSLDAMFAIHDEWIGISRACVVAQKLGKDMFGEDSPAYEFGKDNPDLLPPLDLDFLTVVPPREITNITVDDKGSIVGGIQ